MPKVQPSSEEFDERYSAGNTSWFIFTSSSRNAEVAKYLGVPSVYCVGMHPGKTRNPEVVFIQPNRNIDKRNDKVNYLVVTDFEDICNVVDILYRKLDKAELNLAIKELNRDTELAKQGLL